MSVQERVLMENDVEKLYDAVTDVKLTVARIESLQSERHGANLATLNGMKDNVKNLWKDTCNKPCGTNNARIENLEKHVVRIYWLIFVVIVLGIIVGVWLKT